MQEKNIFLMNLNLNLPDDYNEKDFKEILNKIFLIFKK